MNDLLQLDHDRRRILERIAQRDRNIGRLRRTIFRAEIACYATAVLAACLAIMAFGSF